MVYSGVKVVTTKSGKTKTLLDSDLKAAGVSRLDFKSGNVPDSAWDGINAAAKERTGEDFVLGKNGANKAESQLAVIKNEPPKDVPKSRWSRMIDQMESADRRANRADAEEMAIAAKAYLSAGGKWSDDIIEPLPISQPTKRRSFSQILKDVESLNEADKKLTAKSFDSTSRMIETSAKIRAVNAAINSRQLNGTNNKQKQLKGSK